MVQDWGEQYGDDWAEVSEYVKKRDDYTCQSCEIRGRKHGPAELHAHHIHQKSEGGSDDPSNLVTLCWRCHNEAHDHFVRPMTEKARTNRTSVSATSSRSSNTTEQTWKISDGPADESLQRIANDIYESGKHTTTKQKHRHESGVTDGPGVTVERNANPEVPKVFQLSTLGQDEAISAEGYTAHGFSSSVLIIISAPIFVLALLINQSFISSALITLLLAAIAYPLLYKRSKPLAEDLNRIDELVDPYEKKKREINNLIKQDGEVPDEDIKDLRAVHKDISEIVSRTNNGYFSDRFVDQVEMTTSDIERLEQDDITFQT